MQLLGYPNSFFMSLSKDLKGQKFNRWRVLEKSHTNKHGKIMWLCQCICGTNKVVNGADLRNNKSKSCGCWNNENILLINITHGNTKQHKLTPEYKTWTGIKDRCNNPNNKGYKNYGGRGIKVCDRWLNDFNAFFSDMGKRPSPKHSLDRYPDNDGNYEPSNCRWATRHEQANNTRTNRWIDHNNIKKTLTNWAIHFNINPSTLHSKLKNGESFDEIFTYYNNNSISMP
jgi:hypothetical protein